MRILGPLTLAVALLGGRTAAKDFFGRVVHHGTVGLGEKMYAPVTCAYACRSTMASWMLICSGSDASMNMSSMGGMSMPMMMMPTPDCYATNDPFLQSLAWCIKAHCPSTLKVSELEDYWEMNVAGRMDNQPFPKYSYQHALSLIATPPTKVHNSSLMLNGTELVSEHMYEMNFGSLQGIELNISLDNRYALVALLIASLSPVLFSLLRFLPLPPSAVSKFYAHVIDPPAFGSHHAVPVFFGLGIMPTRGQALFIFYIWAINIILSAVSYKITWPNLWFTSISNEMVEWIANRVGMLSFANLIAALLYSSRNNVLLHVTSWSRNTFVLVHRWIAVICILQACLHSALYLQFYSYTSAALATESAYPYWYWGIIATFALVFILPGSLLPIRRKAYEFFLTWHIVWSLLAIIGSFLHIYFRYRWQWGYELWVAVAFSVWAFDWLLARPFRLAKNGFNKRAYISIIDEDYLKINIPNVDAIGHVYLYFPTLSWRIWENHPFSVVPISGFHTISTTTPTSPPSEDLELGDGKPVAKSSTSDIHQPHGPPGITFIIRKGGGLTGQLIRHAESSEKSIPVLVESSYGLGSLPISRSPDTRPSLQYPNLICIAGGVGITGVLTLLDRPLLAPHGQTKLYWGVRSEPIVRAVEQSFGAQTVLHDSGKSKWGNAEAVVSVGKRLNFAELLAADLKNGGLVGGTTVVACGPPGLLDEVRIVVANFAQGGSIVRFSEERFSS